MTIISDVEKAITQENVCLKMGSRKSKCQIFGNSDWLENNWPKEESALIFAS